MSVFVLRVKSVRRDEQGFYLYPGEPSKVVVVADSESQARFMAGQELPFNHRFGMCQSPFLDPDLSPCENIGAHNTSLSVPFIVAVES